MQSTLLMKFKNLSQPALLAGGFALLMVIGFGAVLLSGQATKDAASIAHTLDVERKVQNLLVAVRRSESAQRGLMLTGNAAHLDDFHRNSGQMLPALELVAQLTADNPRQQEHVARLRTALRAKLTEMNDSVRLYQDNRVAAAIALVRSDSGRQYMNDIRDIAAAMSEEEQRLLALRTAESRRTNAFLLSITIVGAALILVLGVVSVMLLRRTNHERDAARRLLEATNLSLEDAVAARTAELTEANEEIQRFAYIVSHDLRSPLVNIMGFTAELETLRASLFEEIARLRRDAGEIAEMAAESADFDEAIAFIKSSTEKMDRLIGAILRLSREGRREFRPEPIDMTELAQSIAATVSHQATVVGARIEIDPLPAIVSDRLAVEQVLSNLIDNALKYLRPDAPGIIKIEGRTTATHAIVQVRDNGRGIAPEDQTRVFELFRRAGAQDRPGEGIGLAHVRTLVRRLGGTMTLRSTPGEGSTFTVILPKRLEAQAQRTAA